MVGSLEDYGYELEWMKDLDDLPEAMKDAISKVNKRKRVHLMGYDEALVNLKDFYDHVQPFVTKHYQKLPVLERATIHGSYMGFGRPSQSANVYEATGTVMHIEYLPGNAFKTDRNRNRCRIKFKRGKLSTFTDRKISLSFSYVGTIVDRRKIRKYFHISPQAQNNVIQYGRSK